MSEKLYYRKDCPFCKKVLNFATENNIKLELRDVEDDNNLNDLLNLGGKKQTPFLIDEEKNIQMYESDDIIEYLKNL